MVHASISLLGLCENLASRSAVALQVISVPFCRLTGRMLSEAECYAFKPFCSLSPVPVQLRYRLDSPYFKSMLGWPDADPEECCQGTATCRILNCL